MLKFSMNEEEFKTVLNDFYQQLMARQKPLDPEFEKILHENLWELYEN
jgi:hypothetical protein